MKSPLTSLGHGLASGEAVVFPVTGRRVRGRALIRAFNAAIVCSERAFAVTQRHAIAEYFRDPGLPTGLTPGAVYYVESITRDTFTVAVARARLGLLSRLTAAVARKLR